MQILIQNELERYFHDKINNLDNCLDETKAYIFGIYKDYLNNEKDLSKESLTLVFKKAKEEYSFAQFQTLADWILFAKTSYPKSLIASETYYDFLAKESYYKCYLILNKKLIIFEELSDKFTYFVEAIKIV